MFYRIHVSRILVAPSAAQSCAKQSLPHNPSGSVRPRAPGPHPSSPQAARRHGDAAAPKCGPKTVSSRTHRKPPRGQGSILVANTGTRVTRRDGLKDCEHPGRFCFLSCGPGDLATKASGRELSAESLPIASSRTSVVSGFTNGATFLLSPGNQQLAKRWPTDGSGGPDAVGARHGGDLPFPPPTGKQR